MEGLFGNVIGNISYWIICREYLMVMKLFEINNSILFDVFNI